MQKIYSQKPDTYKQTNIKNKTNIQNSETIISICEQIHNAGITNQSEFLNKNKNLREKILNTIHKLADSNHMNNPQQSLNQVTLDQMCAFISVYACINNGQPPANLCLLHAFLIHYISFDKAYSKSITNIKPQNKYHQDLFEQVIQAKEPDIQAIQQYWHPQQILFKMQNNVQEFQNQGQKLHNGDNVDNNQFYERLSQVVFTNQNKQLSPKELALDGAISAFSEFSKLYSTREGAAIEWVKLCMKIFNDPSYATRIKNTFAWIVSNSGQYNPQQSLNAESKAAIAILCICNGKQQNDTRGFFKAVVIGYIYAQKNQAFNLDGSFNREGFRTWLTLQGSKDFNLLASFLLNLVNKHYLKSIRLDQQTNTVTFGTKNYKNQWKIEPNHDQNLIQQPNNWQAKLNQIIFNDFCYEENNPGYIKKQKNGSSFEAKSNDAVGKLKTNNINSDQVEKILNDLNSPEVKLTNVFMPFQSGNIQYFAKTDNGDIQVLFMCGVNSSFAKNASDVRNGTYKSIKMNNILVTSCNGQIDVKHVVLTEEFDFKRKGHDAARNEKKAISEGQQGIYLRGASDEKVYIATKENITVNQLGGIKGAAMNQIKKKVVSAITPEQLNQLPDDQIKMIFNFGIDQKISQQYPGQINNEDRVNEYLTANKLEPLTKDKMITHIIENKEIALSITGDAEAGLDIVQEGSGGFVESTQDLIQEGFQAHEILFNQRYTPLTQNEQENKLKLTMIKPQVENKYQQLDPNDKKKINQLLENYQQLNNNTKEQGLNMLKFLPKETKVQILKNILPADLHNEVLNYYTQLSSAEEQDLLEQIMLQNTKNIQGSDLVLQFVYSILDSKFAPKPDTKYIFIKEYSGKELESILKEQKNQLTFKDRKKIALSIISALGQKPVSPIFKIFSNEVEASQSDNNQILPANFKNLHPVFDIKTKNMLFHNNQVQIIDDAEFEHTFMYKKSNALIDEAMEEQTRPSISRNIIETKQQIKQKKEKPNQLLEDPLNVSPGMEMINKAHILKIQQNFEIMRSLLEVLDTKNKLSFKFFDNKSFIQKFVLGKDKSKVQSMQIKNSGILKNSQVQNLNDTIEQLINNEHLTINELQQFVEDFPSPDQL